MLAPLLAIAAAGAVIALAAWRSSRVSARQGVLPASGRWPLPGRAVLDSAGVRRVAQTAALALMTTALAGPALGVPTALALVGAGWVVALVASAVVGPLWPAASPLRLMPVSRRRRPPAAARRRLGAWPVAGILSGVAALVIVGPPPDPVVAALLAVALVAGAAVTWLFGGEVAEQVDPAAALASVAGALAPVGRSAGGWSLRSPVPALARRPERRGERALLAVIAGAAAAHLLAPAAQGWVGHSGATLRLAVLVGTVGVTGLAIQLAAIRSYLVPALTAAAAGWTLAHHLWVGLGAAGAPRPAHVGISVTALLAGHLVGVAAGHRAALARLDLRAARAVQFPLRVVLTASAAAGAALLAG